MISLSAFALSFILISGRFNPLAAALADNNRDRSFDSDWRFFLGDAPGAESPGFDDTAWRTLDIPHDWSIEDLPPLEKPAIPELAVTDGQWRFQKGDDPEWKTPGFDDSQWQTVTLPDNWEHHSNYTNDNVYGWFRRRIEIPAECQGRDFDLLLGKVDDVDETFLNGQRIGGTGTFPPDYRTAWDTPRHYHVPASVIRGDGSDVLAVRVFDGSGNGGIYEAGMRSVRFGPFDPGHSEGSASTGHVLGGIGWYRKHFALAAADNGKRVVARFDGIYMNADFWINGQPLGNHPYGYTGFEFDLTPYLKSGGQENVLSVRVRNEGKNSRWYSGSGIYRHAWLTVTDPIHVVTGGLFVTTPEVSKEKTIVKIASEICNGTGADATLLVRARMFDASHRTVGTAENQLHLQPARRMTLSS